MSSLRSRQNAADTQTEGELQPEPTTADRSERIREIAYYLWLDEGCPEGGAERHWARAETLLDSEPEARKRIEGEPPGEPVAAAPPALEVRRARRAL